MKIRKLYLISVLCLTLLFILSIGNLGTLALEQNENPTVTLLTSGGSAAFTFNRDDGNLFDNFDGVMPGDTLSQTITVESAEGNSGVFKVYLYAANGDETAEGFLEAMTLKVFDGPEELNVMETGNSRGVLLGTFSPGSSKNLTVSLTIPIAMKNSFQGASSLVDWYFYAEQLSIVDPPSPPSDSPSPSPSPSISPSPEIPDDDTPTDDLPDIDIPDDGTPTDDMPVVNPDLPQTGDNGHTMLWVLLMVGSGSALTVLFLFGHEHRPINK